MANDAILNSLWGKDYVLGRREAEEMLSPEEQIINREENDIWRTVETIYLEQGVEELIRYYFLSLKFKKFEQVEIILEFFQRMGRSQFPLKISSKRTENRLVREAQIERNKTQNNNYNMRLGQTLFGREKFDRMVRAR
ncbi:MAG: hypothetical protein V1877_00290 [Candidatus Tagabacteria bacterium]